MSKQVSFSEIFMSISNFLIQERYPGEFSIPELI